MTTAISKSKISSWGPPHDKSYANLRVNLLRTLSVSRRVGQTTFDQPASGASFNQYLEAMI